MNTTSTDVVGTDTPTTRSKKYILFISKSRYKRGKGNYIIALDRSSGQNRMIFRKKYHQWEKLEPQVRGVFL